MKCLRSRKIPAFFSATHLYTTSGTTQPIGSLTSVTFGSNDSDTFGYDTLTGRLTNYTFKMNGATAKSGALTWNANGSLGALALTDNVTPANTQSCSYSHDDLGRIASANCSPSKWGQTFAYDPFGNIKKTATVGTSFLPLYDLTSNRYASIPGCTRTYDGDGRLTNDCSHSYSWLADGTLATVDTVGITYDALGRAVEQARGSSYTQIVYTPGGGKLALMSGATVQKAFIPLPGGGTAVYTSTVNVAYYRHADWLGSSRLATTPATPTTVYADTEYAPFGEAYGQTGTLDLNFTGQNQDTVPSSNGGVYDFLFREYNPQHGRWISPDPAGRKAVSLAAPQTWNRYAYVANGPLNGTDSLGLVRGWMEVRGSVSDPAFDAFLNPGAAFINSAMQEFYGQNSPMEQAKAIYQAQVDCGFNPGSCPNGVPGTPGGPVLVPGGAIYGSYSTKYDQVPEFLLGTFNEFSVPNDEVWDGYKADAYRQVRRWWRDHWYYRGGLTEEDATASQLAYLISMDTTTMFTPCEAIDAELWVGGVLIPAETAAGKGLENFGKGWALAYVLGMSCE